MNWLFFLGYLLGLLSMYTIGYIRGARQAAALIDGPERHAG